MDRLPYHTPPRWWAPNLRTPFIRGVRPLRVFLRQKRREKVLAVDVRGGEHVRDALVAGRGVMITAKHNGHADAFVFLAAGDRLRCPFYYMVAWQVFQLLGPLGSWFLQRHGSFSIDRESYDVRAFRQAVEIVQHSRHPLVVFAEGEVYHNCERVFPLRPGAAAVALAAAKRADRPVVAIPAAIRYEFLSDPMPHLDEVTTRLERHLLWTPRPDLPLAERLYRVAEETLARRESHYLGAVRPGPYVERTSSLADAILRRLEEAYALPARDADVPGRATQLRHLLIQKAERLPPGDARRRALDGALEDIEAAIQLYSYTHDYDREGQSVERLAEIVDKYEEDVLGVPMALAHTPRRALIQFGPPVDVPARSGGKESARLLTETLQQRLQALVDELYELRRPAAVGELVHS
jgi:1-acyl-sn-glycerol-3-phosphate acyltransferase